MQKIDEDNAVQKIRKQFKIKVQKQKIHALDDGKLLDEVQYGSVTILDADDLETICQCELSITDFQRQKGACLAVMTPQSPASNGVPEEAAPDEVVEERAPPPTKREKVQLRKIAAKVKRHLDQPDVKFIPPTFLKPSSTVWAVLKAETCGVAFEMTADAQADSSVNFQIVFDGLPIGIPVPGQTGLPKPDSLEIGMNPRDNVLLQQHAAGRSLPIVNQKMPEVRYLAPFTVSLLTERTGDRRSYNDDVSPKNDWPRYTCTPKEEETFIAGNAQHNSQKLECDMNALLENIQENKSFPTCRFWPNEACVLGTKCCLQ